MRVVKTILKEQRVHNKWNNDTYKLDANQIEWEKALFNLFFFWFYPSIIFLVSTILNC